MMIYIYTIRARGLHMQVIMIYEDKLLKNAIGLN